MEQSRNYRRYVIWIPVFLWGALILTVSSFPQKALPSAPFFSFDKVAHFAEYFIFAGIMAFTDMKRNRGRVFVRNITWIFLFVAVFASFDEAHQALIPGRFPSFFDLLADVMGGAVAVAICYVCYRKRREIRGHNT